MRLKGSFDLYDKRWVEFAATAAIIGGVISLIFFAVHLYAFWSRSLVGGPLTKVARSLADCCGPPDAPGDIARELLWPGFRIELTELWDEVKTGDTALLRAAVGIFPS